MHRTAHRPLCHEYLAPDRTTFSGLSSFYTVLWHITLKAIRKKQSSSRASNTPPPGQPQVIPHILQNTFSPIGHRTFHRPLCHEYLAPDRTTFSSLSSFYTVLWHITLKAICKITELLTCLKHATSGHPKFSLPFCKTPSAQSASEPPTGHFVMNISPPIARLFQDYRHSTLFCGTLL